MKQIKNHLACLLLSLTATTQAAAQTETGNDGWNLVWHEEFNTDGQLNPADWNFEKGYVRNHEAQWYQSGNARCEKGCLIIEARKDEAHPYTSASVNTAGKHAWRYGRMVVRAKIPTASGAWPAIWTLGSGLPWPSCGEIDIMEYYRIKDVPHILANAAWGKDKAYDAQWNSKTVPFSHFTDRDPQWAEKFHTWRMDWDKDYIRLYLDDELLNEIDLTTTVNGAIGQGSNPFHQPQYLLLNLALGGDHGGEIDESALPMRYEIDYVRVYQKNGLKGSIEHPLVCDTLLSRVSDKAFRFSMPVEDGNYKVTVTLGSKKRAAHTVVRGESGRLFVEGCTTKKRQLETVSFIVNKRSPELPDGGKVSLKPREHDYLNWDGLLNLEFNGQAPAVERIRIERDTTVTTLFLCGNSTVVDQEYEPYKSWGQMVTRWFDDQISISNHAESGLTARTFINGRRLDKVLSMMRPGDYVFCEFGHNDQKEHRPGDGAYYHFAYHLKLFIDKVREKGGTIVFITPTQRRFFDEATQTKIMETHLDYPDAMRDVARRENVPVIELHDMTRTFFETLGFEDSKKSLVHYPAGTYPGQDKDLADNTHFNPYGAYEVAKMVVMGMKQLQLPFVSHLRTDWQDYDPAHPDDPSQFVWFDTGRRDVAKPDGN